MRTVGAYEAKTHLARLLEEVAGGETITITRHGKPIAELRPASAASRRRPADVIAALRSARRGVTLGTVSLRKLIDEGRA
jgi:prevent-host-death family protein